MFRTVLIANRGEIAVRIIRTCKELGIKTVAVFSEADRTSRHVALADQAVCIGPAQSAKSYLDVANVVAAAAISGAEAIHPGYGFLAENSRLPWACREQGIAFVGPSPEVMERLADKVRARRELAAAGLPVVPGSDATATLTVAQECARELGYPLMLKAAAGGGGRGLRILRDAAELTRFYPLARAEAESAFGDGRLYLERYLERARHIEIQLLVDGHGKSVHLGERDCSIQRRHQKLLEESPSPAMSGARRHKLSALAGRAARAAATLGYRNAGTMEFLMDEQGGFYFIEMNTRLQVEHAVTEATHGIDLVQLQLAIAAGEPLPAAIPTSHGHAIECRINAEDPAEDFAPRAGLVDEFVPPGGPGVRVDTHVFAGYRIPPFYDSLLAKVIVYGLDRAAAVARMRRALEEFTIRGVSTTIPFHLRLLSDPHFLAGQADTTYVERMAA